MIKVNIFNVIWETIVGIYDLITSLFAFVIALFTDLVYMIIQVGKVISNSANMSFWLPTSVIALVGVIIAISVVYLVSGRGGH